MSLYFPLATSCAKRSWRELLRIGTPNDWHVSHVGSIKGKLLPQPDPGVAALDVHEIVEQFAVDTATGKLQKLTEAGPLGRESALPRPQRRTAPKKTKRK